MRRDPTAGQERAVLCSSSLFPSGVFRAHRSGAYVTRVWGDGAAVRAKPAPTTPATVPPPDPPQGRHNARSPEARRASWRSSQDAPANGESSAAHPDFQEECLPLLEDAVARGDASARDLAYLMDRVLMHRGQPQVYGTQYTDRDGVLTLWTVSEPGGLGARRAALGLEPEAQNLARLLAARRREQQPE